MRLQNWRKYKKRKRKEDGLVERREKTIKTPILSNLIFSSFLVYFEEFKKLLVWYLKLYKSTWKHRDSERMHKKFKLQNENCFFEPTSNIVPFASKRHILSIHWTIQTILWFWMYHMKGYKIFFLSPKEMEPCLRIYKSLFVSMLR